ncbi:MAG: homoserine dehydrogenase [Firmicutes bacterium]|nr:homoserine dehydrogenase [Bacillota bacterium]
MASAKKEINVGIVGLGTVGGGTATVLAMNADPIEIRAVRINVAAVADILLEKSRAFLDGIGLQDTKLTDDWMELINDPDIDIIVETVGGTTFAYTVISTALAAGKSVVTANKDLMALRGGELLAIAEEHHTDLFFEASVCGAIPVVQAAKEGLAGNKFKSIMGIMNGTTNYILSKMDETGADFADALKEAQDLGYAEADPTSDVEGYDAARKVAILSSIAFNSRVTFDMVACEGITNITKWDMLYAKEFGYVIKMVGIARHDINDPDSPIEARVHPLMIPKSHPLASVRDSYNAVFIEGNAVEKTMFYGRGAGDLPTGSAIVGDIIQAARNIVHDCKSRWGCTCRLHLPVMAIDDIESKYFIRMAAYDKVGTFAVISKTLAENAISLETVMQKRKLDEDKAEIVIITHKVRHADMMKALAEINELPCICGDSTYIRVENEEM